MCEIARLIVFPPEVPVTGKGGYSTNHLDENHLLLFLNIC